MKLPKLISRKIWIVEQNLDILPLLSTATLLVLDLLQRNEICLKPSELWNVREKKEVVQSILWHEQWSEGKEQNHDSTQKQDTSMVIPNLHLLLFRHLRLFLPSKFCVEIILVCFKSSSKVCFGFWKFFFRKPAKDKIGLMRFWNCPNWFHVKYEL